ncbi:unnamed protein product [Clonostachys chloroleuca]|uniref:Uncharacterized protein n=1 Tax=Clonostachys chloroleuca TaxID=1926264 RepID=A0AA35PX56_9HYPO|nr:unnamed protein product [Clonostachys chloroleuca]
MPEIKSPFVTKQKLQEKTSMTLEIQNPDPSSATKNKSYWIQGIVKNCTHFDIQVRPPAYFYTGRYETWPTEVGAWSVGQFTGVYSDDSIAGVTGGNAWDLHLEQGIWHYKSGVVESATAEDGYDIASEGGNEIVSNNQFYGVDTDGNEMTIIFEVQCSGGQRPVYIINQVVD